MKRIAPDVWLLDGFPRNAFNIYLVGDVLIDTGTRWARRRIQQQLRGRRLSLVALTHAHPDHQGCARWVCERYGVPLACHEADVPVVEGRQPMLKADRQSGRLLNILGRLWAGPPCPVGRVLQEGDLVAGFRVFHLPGHTPGHVIYFRESDRVAIIGDVVNNMNIWTGGPGLHEPPAIFCSDPAQNRESIHKLIALGPSVVCFGHGPPLLFPRLLEEFASRLESTQVLPSTQFGLAVSR